MDEEFDYLAAFDAIRSLVPGDESVSQKMHALIEACETQFPHVGWTSFRELSFDGEAAALASWFRDKIDRDPPVATIAAFWFGLDNPITPGRGVVADFDMYGSSAFDPRDETFG